MTLNDRLLVEPDIALWRKGIDSQDVRGPQLLLVVEIAVSSLPYDLREKARIYASHDVADYWVVDAIRNTVRVHRQPTDGRYAQVEEFVEGEPLIPLLLPNVRLLLDELE